MTGVSFPLGSFDNLLDIGRNVSQHTKNVVIENFPIAKSLFEKLIAQYASKDTLCTIEGPINTFNGREITRINCPISKPLTEINRFSLMFEKENLFLFLNDCCELVKDCNLLKNFSCEQRDANRLECHGFNEHDASYSLKEGVNSSSFMESLAWIENSNVADERLRSLFINDETCEKVSYTTFLLTNPAFLVSLVGAGAFGYTAVKEFFIACPSAAKFLNISVPEVPENKRVYHGDAAIVSTLLCGVSLLAAGAAYLLVDFNRSDFRYSTSSCTNLDWDSLLASRMLMTALAMPALYCVHSFTSNFAKHSEKIEHKLAAMRDSFSKLISN